MKITTSTEGLPDSFVRFAWVLGPLRGAGISAPGRVSLYFDSSCCGGALEVSKDLSFICETCDGEDTVLNEYFDWGLGPLTGSSREDLEEWLAATYDFASPTDPLTQHLEVSETAERLSLLWTER